MRTIVAFDCRSRNAFTTSTPVSAGIVRSSKTTSGFNSSVLLTASLPSSASPQTSHSWVEEFRRFLRACLKLLASSAIKIRRGTFVDSLRSKEFLHHCHRMDAPRSYCTVLSERIVETLEISKIAQIRSRALTLRADSVVRGPLFDGT